MHTTKDTTQLQGFLQHPVYHNPRSQNQPCQLTKWISKYDTSLAISISELLEKKGKMEHKLMILWSTPNNTIINWCNPTSLGIKLKMEEVRLKFEETFQL